MLKSVAATVLFFVASLPLLYSNEIEEYQDSLDRYFDTVFFHSSLFYLPPGDYAISESDYAQVAEELGVETAAIRAVVEIETGKNHSGFYSKSHPIINFDRSLFSRNVKKSGISVPSATYSRIMADAGGKSHEERNSTRFSLAAEVDETLAVESTFWGMFQIGGFNWRRCGATSVKQFEYLMSRSERDQLELFAHFLVSTDLVKYLKTKNWAAFARHYNGPKYRARGYHTRLAAAYKKFSK